MNFVLFFLAIANPFAIEFAEKKELTNDDYIEAQKLLRKIDIVSPLLEIYPADQGYSTFDDFYRRCSVGIKQILIDPEKGNFPEKNLVKIGKGGDCCIVSFTSYNKKYGDYIRQIPKLLEDVGFNGYFYYRVGGYPNPTGKDIRYAGVPYSFKIPLMLEAEQLGFDKVLWIDAPMIPLKNLSSVFEQIEQMATFFLLFVGPDYEKQFLLPKTNEFFLTHTGVDVTQKHIRSGIFGLKMSDPLVKEFVKKYYEFLEMGTPFFSCSPEENVFGAIFFSLKDDYPFLWHSPFLQYPIEWENPASIESLKQSDSTFYLRKH
jgi:hypothetical protein